MSTMTVLTNFVPIHELDDVLYDSNNNYRSDALKDEDLFLISQLSAPSSPESDSIILSKKLQFNTLKLKISDDIDMQCVKDNINELCTNLNDLSDKVLDLSDTVNQYKDELSNDYIRRDNELCSNLSTNIANNYIKKYGTSELSAPEGKFFSKLVLENGKISDKSEIDDFRKFLNVDGVKVSSGCVSGDKLAPDVILSVNNSTTTQLTCHIVGDCFLTITTQLLETDDSTKPLEVYIRHNDTGSLIKIAQFNNPGGLSGVKYYNYYYNGFPLKCHFDEKHESLTDIVIKYVDDSHFKYSTQTGFNDSKVIISQYVLYATVAESDISDFVSKDSNTKQNILNLYKIATNQNGLVTKTEVVNLGTEVSKVLSVASDSSLGVIKTNSTLNDQDDGKFGVKLDNDNKAYVQIPRATISSYGIYKTLTSGTGITVNSSTNTVSLNIASDTTLGGIKTYTGLSDTTNRTFGLKKDTSNRAYVQIPEATTNVLGLTKKVQSGTGITINTTNNSVNLNNASTNSLGGIKTGFTTDVNNRNYKVDIKNANAYVNIPIATDTGYGVVRLNDLNFVPLQEPDPEEEDNSLIPGMVQIINTTPVIVQQFLRKEYNGQCIDVSYVEYDILTKKRNSQDGDIIDFPDIIDISSAIITSEELSYGLTNKIPYVTSRINSEQYPGGRLGTAKITPFYMELPSLYPQSYKIFAKRIGDNEVDEYVRDILNGQILYDEYINIPNKVYTYATKKILTQNCKKYIVMINGNFQSDKSIYCYNIYNDSLGTVNALQSGTTTISEINPEYRSTSSYSPRGAEKFSYLRRYVTETGYKHTQIGNLGVSKDTFKSRTLLRTFSYSSPYNSIRVVMSGYEGNHTELSKFKCSNVRIRVFGIN